MRVALVTSSYSPHVGGVERHVQNLAQNLVHLGCEVEVLTQAGHGSPASVEEAAGGFLVRRWPDDGWSEASRVSFGLLKYLRSERGRYEVVHAHNYHSAAPAISYLAGCRPLIVSTCLHARPASNLARVGHVPYGILGHRILRGAAAVIALSQSEAGLVRERMPGVHPVVIPSGIDASHVVAIPPMDKDCPVVLCVGRLMAYKRVASVVEVLPLLGDVRLVVAGRGPEAARLERLADKCGVRGKLRLLGKISDQELALWYATADVLVSLSSDESFGIVVLEGLAAGIRVVASDIPAHRDMRQFDEHAALRLVPLCSQREEIAKVILDGLTVGRCPPSSRVPRWSAVAQRHVDVYESVARGQSV